MLNNNAKMLTYGFNSDEIEAIKNVITENKLPGFISITEDMTNMKIKDILNGLKFPIHNDKSSDNKVILLNNFEDAVLDTAVRALKKLNPDVILAVVTPTSAEWTFSYLLEHLIEERNWFLQNKNKK